MKKIICTFLATTLVYNSTYAPNNPQKKSITPTLEIATWKKALSVSIPTLRVLVEFPVVRQFLKSVIVGVKIDQAVYGIDTYFNVGMDAIGNTASTCLEALPAIATKVTHFGIEAITTPAFCLGAALALTHGAYAKSDTQLPQVEPNKPWKQSGKTATRNYTDSLSPVAKKALEQKLSAQTVDSQKKNLALLSQTQRMALGQKAAIGITATAKTMQWNITPKQGA